MSFIQERSLLTGHLYTFRSAHACAVFKLSEFERGVIRVQQHCDEFAWTDMRLRTRISSFEFKQVFYSGETRYLRADLSEAKTDSTELTLALENEAKNQGATFRSVYPQDLQSDAALTKNKLLGHSYLSTVTRSDLDQIEPRIQKRLKEIRTGTPKEIAADLNITLHLSIACCVSLWRSNQLHAQLNSALIGPNWAIEVANEL